MKKHAYLIMAHNEKYILERLIKLLDDERNDLYIHIDSKCKSISEDYVKSLVGKSSVFFLKSLDVRWGSYKQIQCELMLLEEALKNNYSYYHFISGVDLPLVSVDEIYDFCNKNNGKEFIHFCYHHPIDDHRIERVKYYHLFTKNLRSNNKFLKKIYQKLHSICLKTQKLFKFSRIKRFNDYFMFGANWFSITDGCARYVLSQKKEIKKRYKYTLCADEIFLQTIVYHSKYYDNVYSKNDDDYNGILRAIDWNRGEPYTYTVADFEDLINSGAFFARKFSTKVDKEVIDKIYDYLMKKKGQKHGKSRKK